MLVGKIILMVTLTGSVFAQNCNRHNWEKYYNSIGRDMRGCNLTDYSLRKADLAGADLSGADFMWTKLEDVNLTDTDLTGANLTGIKSDGIFGTPKALPDGWALVDGYLIGSSANLTGANLTKADLTGVDLRLSLIHI